MHLSASSWPFLKHVLCLATVLRIHVLLLQALQMLVNTSSWPFSKHVLCLDTSWYYLVNVMGISDGSECKTVTILKTRFVFRNCVDLSSVTVMGILDANECQLAFVLATE